MNFEYIRMSSAEEAEQYSLERGHWIVANVRQSIGWPENKVIVYFRDMPILFIPEKNDSYPAIAVLCKNGITQDKAREIINHFLSSLAWGSEKSVAIESLTGGGRPHVMGRARGCRILSRSFRIMYLPDTLDSAARLALAFYREAISLDHIAYSFLSYYKIINLRYRTGADQKDWLESKLTHIDQREGKQRLESLRQKLGADAKVAEYLYHSCRCAIAHADVNQEIINPENYEDTARLREDLPLIKSLAEILIEEELDVLRPTTIYKTHPYELFGFKSLLGVDLISRIKGKENVKNAEVQMPGSISLRLWGEPPYKIFEAMKTSLLSIENGSVVIQANTVDDKVTVVIALDFVNERIIFDPVTSIQSVQDDGSVLMAEYALDILRFLKRYWANGILEIWDSKNMKCLGFSDAFVPVNIDLSRTLDNFEQNIKAHEQEIVKRKA